MPTSCSRTAFHWIILCPETFCLSIANLNSNVIDESSGKGTLEVVQNPPWPKAIFLFFSAALRLSNSIVIAGRVVVRKGSAQSSSRSVRVSRRAETRAYEVRWAGWRSRKRSGTSTSICWPSNSSRVYPKIFSVWAFTTTILPSPSATTMASGAASSRPRKLASDGTRSAGVEVSTASRLGGIISQRADSWVPRLAWWAWGGLGSKPLSLH
jgi:hypothetical protein